jgi:hypothetical protein
MRVTVACFPGCPTWSHSLEAWGGASMGRFNQKTFAQPDLLKSIQPQNLIRLLEPCRELLESHGLSLPRE